VKRHVFGPGDRVRINKSMAIGKNGRYCLATVIRRDGLYVWVKFNYKGIVAERYPSEMVLIRSR
jgi:hypothetical protein